MKNVYPIASKLYITFTFVVDRLFATNESSLKEYFYSNASHRRADNKNLSESC